MYSVLFVVAEANKDSSEHVRNIPSLKKDTRQKERLVESGKVFFEINALETLFLAARHFSITELGVDREVAKSATIGAGLRPIIGTYRA